MSRAAAEVGSTTNSYQILAKLATGGMAEIFLARGAGVGGVERYCVLKRILQDRASDEHFVRMFLEEARLAAQLQHPNVAQVYDIGKLGDSYFFTMEYVHGETVRALLHRAQVLRRWLPLHCVLTVVAGTAAGLHHAHARIGLDGRALGIVHRDVSPSNLMVSYEGGIKVVDFGVAKAADSSHETRSGTVKGKISYLSPEQCKGRRVDRRSDLYSLGICFWEMLATERLYKRASDFENMNAIVSEPVPAPSSRRADVPREIDDVVLRLLAKDPDARFQSAEEVVEAIEEAASQTGALLSTSTLGRFMRELFGQRPEPWLELEAQPGGDVTVTSEPIPLELAIPPTEAVNRQLAGVLDLSAPRSMTESLGSHSPGPLELPTERFGQRAVPGFAFLPPPTVPEADDSLVGLLPSSARETVQLRVATPMPEVTTEPLPPPPRVAGHTATGVTPLPPIPPGPVPLAPGPVPLPGLPPVMASPLPHVAPLTLPPGLHVMSAPPVAPPSHLVPAPPGSFASGPPSVSSGSFAAYPGTPQTPFPSPFVSPGSSHGSMPGASAYTGARRGPLYMVIATAAVLGAIAVVVMMRSVAGGDAGRTTAVLPSAPAKADPPVAAPALPAPAPITAVPIEPAAPPPAPAKPVEVTPPAPARPVDAPSPAAPPDRPAAKASEGSAPSRKAAPAATTAGRTVAKHDAPDDDLSRAFVAGRYDKVLEKCAAGPVSAEHAPLCVIAACQTDSGARARKLIAAAPASKRDQLIEYCKQLGVDITPPKKPAKPVVDCDADPMACQH